MLTTTVLVVTGKYRELSNSSDTIFCGSEIAVILLEDMAIFESFTSQ